MDKNPFNYSLTNSCNRLVLLPASSLMKRVHLTKILSAESKRKERKRSTGAGSFVGSCRKQTCQTRKAVNDGRKYSAEEPRSTQIVTPVKYWHFRLFFWMSNNEHRFKVDGDFYKASDEGSHTGGMSRTWP